MERAVVVAPGPSLDALPGPVGTASAVERDGDVVALGAPGLLHATVYSAGGLKPCTVYSASMQCEASRLSPYAGTPSPMGACRKPAKDGARYCWWHRRALINYGKCVKDGSCPCLPCRQSRADSGGQ